MALSVPDLAADSDRGLSNTDNITSGDDFTFTGKAGTSGNTVFLFDGTVAIDGASGGVEEDGSWSVTAVLPAGKYDIKAQEKNEDDAFVGTATAALKVTVEDATNAPAGKPTLILDAASDTGTKGDKETSKTAGLVFSGKSAAPAVELFVDDVSAGIGAVTSGAWKITTSATTALELGDREIKAVNISKGGASAADDAGAETLTVKLIEPPGAPGAPAKPTLKAGDDTGTGDDDKIDGKTSKAALTIEGTGAEVGATVTLKDGTKTVGTFVVKTDGKWSIQAKGLTDGPHDFTATQKAAGGELDSPASEALSVTVITKLAAPTVDNLFTNKTEDLKVTGTGVEGSKVSLLVDGKPEGDAVDVGEGGKWEAPITTEALLAAGIHTITAKQTDPSVALDSAVSNKASFVIDNVPPAAPTELKLAAASDTGAKNNDGITAGGKALTITGKGEKGATVKLFFDESDTALPTTSPVVVDGTGKWTAIITDGLPAENAATEEAPNDHTITAKQIDAATNESSSSAALPIKTYFVAKPDAPTDLALSAADDTGTAGDKITNKKDLTISGGGLDGATVTLLDGNKSVGTAVVKGGVWSIQAGALAAGQHSFTAKQSKDGSESAVSEEPLEIMVDTTAPAAPAVTKVGETATVDSGKGVAIEGTGEAGAVVRVFNDVNKNDKIDDGELLSAGEDGIGEDLAWTASVNLSGGVYSTIKAIQTDLAGNASAASKAAPTVTVNTPGGFSLAADDDNGTKGDFITNKTANLTLSGNFVPAGTKKVTILEGVDPKGTADVDTKGAWKTDLTLEEGDHQITVQGFEADGTTPVGEASISFTLTVDKTAPEAAPAVTTVGGKDVAEGAVDPIQGANNVTLTGTGEKGAKVELFAGATLLGEGSVGDDDSWKITTSKLKVGANTVTAKQTDLAGNPSPVSEVLNVSVEASGPAKPAGLTLLAADDTGTSDSDGITSKAALTITGTGIAGATVTLKDGTKDVGTGKVGANNAWSIQAKALTDGVHNFTATQKIGTDVSLASNPLAVTVVTKVAAPTVLDLFSKETENLTAHGTGAAGNKISLLIDKKGAPVETVVDQDGHWTAEIAGPLTGTHTLTATQKNEEFGLTSAASAAAKLVIDNVAPAAPTKLDLAAASDSGKSNSDNLTAAGRALTITGIGEPGATVKLFNADDEL
ncbi:MAG: hypothetical protein HQL60_07020, partial [Magnetococcales bacterium]|nr:hypothetical protein [Magnetococcales bacterium]